MHFIRRTLFSAWNAFREGLMNDPGRLGPVVPTARKKCLALLSFTAAVLLLYAPPALSSLSSQEAQTAIVRYFGFPTPAPHATICGELDSPVWKGFEKLLEQGYLAPNENRSFRYEPRLIPTEKGKASILRGPTFNVLLRDYCMQVHVCTIVYKGITRMEVDEAHGKARVEYTTGLEAVEPFYALFCRSPRSRLPRLCGPEAGGDYRARRLPEKNSERLGGRHLPGREIGRMQKKLWSREFTALVSSNLLMASAFYALIPTLPVFLTGDLGISHAHAGLIMAAFSVSALLIRPLAGYLIDNYHRFLVFTLSLTVLTALYGIYPFLTGVAAMFLLRFMHGVTWGMCSSSTAPLVADAVPTSRLGEGMGIFSMSIPVGMTIGPMFGFEMLKGHGAAIMFFSVLGVSALSLLIAFFAKTPAKTIIRKKFVLTGLLNGEAVPLSVCMFFAMIAYGSIVVFVGVYAAQKGFSNASTFFLCFAAALFSSRIFLGKLFDRGYFFSLVLAGVILAVGGMLMLGWAWSPNQFLAAGIVGGFGFGILMPTCQAAVNRLADPHERGAANSTYLVSYDLGTGVGSLLVGFLSDKITLAEIYRCTSLTIALSATIFVFIANPHYHRTKARNTARNSMP
jgi:MFS family permease